MKCERAINVKIFYIPIRTFIGTFSAARTPRKQWPHKIFPSDDKNGRRGAFNISIKICDRNISNTNKNGKAGVNDPPYDSELNCQKVWREETSYRFLRDNVLFAFRNLIKQRRNQFFFPSFPSSGKIKVFLSSHRVARCSSP